jgi:NAD(P)-dependent dehydrogenase (short-subunit alcohol dehydrogenase family)
MANNSFSDLKGKVCVITGGGGVIGSAIAEALASAGVKVAILDRREDIAVSLANELKVKYNTHCIGVACDVLDKEILIKASAIVEEKLGPVDILINGAGGNSPEATTKHEEVNASNLDNPENTFFGLKMEGFHKVFDLNFIGTVLPSMVFGEKMVKRGKGNILNISSMNAYKALTKIPAYSAAKASVNNFTEWLAVHFAKTGVRVNAIAPGFFLTDQNRFLLTDEKTGNLTARGNKIIANTPMGKFGEPEDLQGAVLFLTSDISRFVTGICIPVDGGYNAFGGV